MLLYNIQTKMIYVLRPLLYKLLISYRSVQSIYIYKSFHNSTANIHH